MAQTIDQPMMIYFQTNYFLSMQNYRWTAIIVQGCINGCAALELISSHDVFVQ